MKARTDESKDGRSQSLKERLAARPERWKISTETNSNSCQKLSWSIGQSQPPDMCHAKNTPSSNKNTQTGRNVEVERFRQIKRTRTE